MTLAVNIAQGGSNNVTFRNRIINGAMVFDQRNAGASVTQTTAYVYTLDRWASEASVTSKFTIQQNAGSVTPPAGFSNYLGVTSSSAYSVGASDYFYIVQNIEGFNFYDMNFGTANAKPVTISFWVRSSLTGTFGGAVGNSADNRYYPFTYTISSANTWTQASVTIAGDTSGTWVGATNGIGFKLRLSLGAGSTFSGTAGAWASANYVSATGATSVVGTSGATFYITGVQLEAGTTASPFEYRQYGTELALCQRYYEKSWAQASAIGTSTNTGMFYSTGIASITTTTSVKLGSGQFKVTKRTTPTMVYYDSSGNSNKCRVQVAGVSESDNQPVQDYATGENVMNLYSNAGAVAGNGIAWHFTASAEL
jgi:hypothetical protein